MKVIRTFLGIVLIAAVSVTAGATQFGYSSGSCERDNMFRVGGGTSQGLAMRISHEKLAALKGCTITSISASFGSSRTTSGDIKLFIGTTPIDRVVEESHTITRALQWDEYTFAKPYTITGEESELYIGYQGEVSAATSMLMHDGNLAIPATGYALSGNEWVDIADLGFGCANIRVNIDGAPTITDAIIKPLNTDGFYKANTPYSFAGQIYNFGSEKITSFDLKVSVGDSAPVTKHYTGLDITPASNFDFVLDEYTSTTQGMQSLSLEIVNINNGNDFDAADNTFVGNICFYPREMERTVLVEGFTGQTCSNCPSGHAELNKWVETVPEGAVIEVMHHSGYQPDYFSMDADYDYTFFYGKTSTYAPAAMMNRTLFPSISAYPVWGPSVSTFQKAYDIIQETQPYVSLRLDTSFDKDTREVKIYFKTVAHNDLPTNTNVFNVVLLQDGLEGTQSGAGSGYIHNNVFRGTLTDNAWGKMLPSRACVTAGEYVWEYTFTLPESIFSDYWANTEMTEANRARYYHDVVPENMKLVAYVGALGGDDIAGHAIYNAIEVKLGESHEQAGMTHLEVGLSAAEVENIDVYVSGGHLTVVGEYDNVELYNLRGISLNTDTTLLPGAYVVRVNKGGNFIVKKLIVK